MQSSVTIETEQHTCIEIENHAILSYLYSLHIYIGRPCNGPLTPVKSRLTSIT